MGRFEFERELMGYISQRRSLTQPSLWKQFFSAKSSSYAVTVPVESVKEALPVRVEQPVDMPVSDDVHVESEYESDKKSVFSRVVGWVVSGSPDAHDAAVEPQQSVLVESELKNDLKELAQISIRVFRQLPAHRIRELKESDDFSRFRNILQKHGLSKE
ncbi:hypothetical protein HY485_02450 [Candidatus Woesearchaeota archaeon]|nr:hypothetical protein [Candidatus Woesearchaeota archaeon]